MPAKQHIHLLLLLFIAVTSCQKRTPPPPATPLSTHLSKITGLREWAGDSTYRRPDVPDSVINVTATFSIDIVNDSVILVNYDHWKLRHSSSNDSELIFSWENDRDKFRPLPIESRTIVFNYLTNKIRYTGIIVHGPRYSDKLELETTH